MSDKIKRIQIGENSYDIEPAVTSTLQVDNAAPTLAWSTTSTVGTVDGVDFTVKMPANPVPNAIKNPNSLTIKANSDSTGLIVYDGSVAKTFIIKPSTTAGAFIISDGTTEKTVQLAGKFTDTTYSNATTSKAGLMSTTDKSNLNTLVAAWTADGTDDTLINKIQEVLTAFENAPEGTNIVTALAGKVDKVSGKGLSTNDLTATLKANYDAAYTHSTSTHARTDATKVEASSTNGKIKINGTETTVYTHPGSGTNPHGTTKSDVGLGNVGDFKAVSTVASQGLTSTEKANARANIGAGTSSFSGSYTDLTNKPTINNQTIKSGTTTFGANDVVEIAAGTNVTVTPDTTNKKITISSTNTTYNAATQSAAGLMSATDKTKLDGVATGATKVTTDTVSGWGYTKNTGTVTQVKVGTTAYSPSSGIVSLPAYPTVNNAALTLNVGNQTVSGNNTFTANDATNTTYNVPSATADAYGVVKVSSVNSSEVTVNSESTTTGRYYPVELNSDGKAIVNVPWTDANTHNSHAVISGKKSDGTTDIKGSASSGDITLGDSGITAGTYKRVTVNAKGIVIGGDNTDADTNTWRKVQLNGTDKLGTGTTTNPLNIKAGSNMSITESNGTFTFAATDTNTNTTYDLSAAKSKSNGSVTLDLTAGGSGSGTDSVTIKGTGATTVTTDANGVITINSTDNNTDTHYTTGLYVGATNTKSNAATSNGGTYLKLYDDSTKRAEFKITGSGATTVTSDASGNITISSTDTDTNTHYTNYLQIKGNGTEAVKFTQNADKTLNLKPGTNVSISATSGEITISATDTNTWRGIQNNLTSDSTTDSLSAKQGKELKALIDGKANTSHGTHVSYGTSTANLAPTSSAGTASTVSRSDHVHSDRLFATLVPSGTQITSSSSSPVNLNTTTYLKVGRYFCSQTAQAATIQNCPLSVAFMMEVYSPLSTTIDNETSSAWVYRLRKITAYNTGVQYIQYCSTGATANAWTYGDWYVIPRSKYTLDSSDQNGGNATIGSATKPVYVTSDGTILACNYTLEKSVPSDAKFTDTTYSSKTAASGGTAVSLVTTGEKYNWNAAKTHADSAHAPSDAEKNVQSDWNVTDTSSDAFIKNKPATEIFVVTNGAATLSNNTAQTVGTVAGTALTCKLGTAITISGKMTASSFYASSDRRLKENIKEFIPQKSILDLPVVEFDFKDSKSHHIGCIAQDLQELFPELVETNENGYLSISENKLVYLCILELKKLKAELESLKVTKE